VGADPYPGSVGHEDQENDAAEQGDGPRTILVTGAGGPAGVAVIRALVADGHHVVALDADPAAAGLRLAQEGATLPLANDPGFVPALCDIATSHSPTLLVSTVAEELPALAAGTEQLTRSDIAFWLPDPAAVDRCTDKWRFAAIAEELSVPTPATGLGTPEGVPGPWIVKPRWGRGSRNVFSVDDLEEVSVVLRWVPDPIVQTRASGREFTVDCLVDRTGLLAGAVARWRIETKAGISTRGETFTHPGIVENVARLLEGIGLTGPANVQGFLAPDGTLLFTEVNPRFSGGLPLSLAAGADLVGEYLRGVMGLSLRPERLTARSGVTMVRYHEELFAEAPPG
jgi:carbamoyl-phosphate synthase large subunit